MPWGMRRKMLYAVSALVLVTVFALWIYLTYFNAPPTCFDHTRNGGETGVDCGGPCAALCPNESHAATVLWARPFLVASSTYTAAAYVQNLNIGAGARQVHYSFMLYDKDNALIGQRDGVADLPPVQTIPIIETGIDLGYRKAFKTLFTFSDTPKWAKVSATDIPSFTISGETLSADGTRLSATVTNTSYVDAPSLTVAAVLFDGRDAALAASKSVISVDHKSAMPVVFTWPQPIAGVTHAEITVLPAF